MKRALTLALLSVAALLFATMAAAQRPGDPRGGWIAALVRTMRALPPTGADVQRMCDAPAPPLPYGVTCSAQPAAVHYPCTLASGEPGTCTAPSLAYAFDPPITASAIVTALGLRATRIVSSDVHMTQWWIVGTRPLAAGRRASEHPPLGAWRVRAYVERPTGPVPRERLGASPAYPVGRATPVVRLTFDVDLENPHPGVPPRRDR